jgi:hypothetical protein
VTASEQRGEGDIIVDYSALPAARRGANRASRTQLVLPAGTYRLDGSVKDDGAYLNGVQVELTGGPSAGMRVTANPFFRFYGVAGDAEIRVSKDGYDPQVRRTFVASHQTEDFELVISRPRPIIAGTYTLQVAASAECRADLPEPPRERTYTAVVTQDGARLTVKLGGAKFLTQPPFGSGNSFTGTVEPNRVLFSLRNYLGDSQYTFYPPSVLEELTSSDGGQFVTSFTFFGSVAVTATTRGYAGTLDGSIEVLSMPGPWDYNSPYPIARCISSSHRVVLTR